MPKKTKDASKAEGRDLFSTPCYATELLLSYLKPYTLVWEPAVGQGRMARVLQREHAVWGSDIQVESLSDQLPAESTYEQWDFLKQERDAVWMQQIDYTVSNPPFSKKEKFYHMCMHYWKLYQTPFALLIPAEYNGWIINAVRNDMCQKIIPTRRIDYITPNMLQRINEGEMTQYQSLEEVPKTILPRYSSSDFHSMWLTKGLGISTPRPVLPAEIYVELSLKSKKENIL